MIFYSHQEDVRFPEPDVIIWVQIVWAEQLKLAVFIVTHFFEQSTHFASRAVKKQPALISLEWERQCLKVLLHLLKGLGEGAHHEK